MLGIIYLILCMLTGMEMAGCLRVKQLKEETGYGWSCRQRLGWES